MQAAATVRTVLEAERQEGSPFDKAWRRALRHLEAPEGCDPRVAAELEEDRSLLREDKEAWRAAYERRRIERAQLAAGMAHARRRLRDMLLSEGDLEAELEDAAD